MNSKIYTTGTAVIYEDHGLFAATFSMLLERTGFFSAVNCFNKEEDILRYFAMKPSGNIFLFTDYFIPNSNVIHLIADLRRFCPTVRVVVVSSLTNAGLIRKILAQKVDAFISKIEGSEEVIACINSILRRELYLSPHISSLLEKEKAEKAVIDFTPRELEILTQISWGKSTGEISDELNLSKHTVLTHRKNMLAKTECNSITELLAYALRTGLIVGN